MSLNSNSINLYHIKSIYENNGNINCVSVFPSGNIISVTWNGSIIIYNLNFNIIQTIKTNDNDILYISIKDENNFITCSRDKYIKIWKKISNKFELFQIIKNAHTKWIYKVLYLNNLIISCSNDKNIKIWEINKDNKYQCITILSCLNSIYSFLLLKEKNILITSGKEGTRFWDIITYKNILYIENAKCYLWNALDNIDNDKIIVGGEFSNFIIKIISISEKKIIKEIKNDFWCFCINVIKDKKIILIGGDSNNINIYNYNFECINKIQNAHDKSINGFIKIKNNLICSFSNDGNLKIWSFNKININLN